MTAVDPALTSWLPVPPASDFPIQNLPYGVFTAAGRRDRRVGVAIGEHVVDLCGLAHDNLLPGSETLIGSSLDPLLAAGRGAWRALRDRLVSLLAAGTPQLDAIAPHVLPMERVSLHLPFEAGDYVDFYSSLEHATNLGRLLRPGGEPLLDNWRHLPAGYHGRSASLVPSGTPVRRPLGQRRDPGQASPSFGATRQLDFELEIGFVVGPGNDLGVPIAVEGALDHVFGLVLVNDWSARDVQAWEYQPLGPFLGKSFATSVSPWVVPLDALEPFFVPGPAQEPEPLPYLRTTAPLALDIELRATLSTAAMRAEGLEPVTLTAANARGLYWNMAQQLAHLTVNGARVRPGDLCASGTISGTVEGSYGSLIESTARGERPLRLPTGETRAFLEDGDEVRITAWAERGALRVGFGEVTGTVVPALADEVVR